MKSTSRVDSASESEPLSPEQEAAAKAAAGWVNLLARTLKTCRLYEATNPTVVKFRVELAAALRQVTDQHGPLTLAFTADDVLFENVSLYPAKSRDDNLAFPFFRDGVRRLTFGSAMAGAELDAFLHAVLLVTGQNLENNDLVTLLWEAHLPHLDVDYVPGEPDAAAVNEAEKNVPWPTTGVEEGETTSTMKVEDVSGENPLAASRSDDWSVGELTAEIEAGFEELETIAPDEVQRFLDEYEQERKVSVVTCAIATVRAFLLSPIDPPDRVEIVRFLPRVLRQAFVQGSWSEAAVVVRMLEETPCPEWSKETFGQELLQPISVSSIRERLEQQDPAQDGAFIDFVRTLGEPGLDLLLLVLADTQNARLQRQLGEEIVERCRDNPERLAPGLSDPRWFVVKNVVQMLGTIGGDTVAGMLRAVVHHPEMRVRLEVLSALRNVPPRHARPLLSEMLHEADVRMFCSILHLLSQERDPGTAEWLLASVIDPEFEKRSTEEKRAIYSALSATAGDECLPELEAELHKGNWFSRTQETHRQAVARCIARIGTPLAREALERGAASKRAPIRKACEDAIVRFGRND